MCRHCNERVPFLEVPTGFTGVSKDLPIELTPEWALVKEHLKHVLDQVYYDSGMKLPHYPMPAIRQVVDFVPLRESTFCGVPSVVAGMSIVIWEAPFNIVKIWSGDLSRPEMGVWDPSEQKDI